MKNDLTHDEWIELAAYLAYTVNIELPDTTEQANAIRKVLEIADLIKGEEK